MSDFPKAIAIKEEGPREGFQIESADIPAAGKIELINALSETGLRHMQIVSFVNPKKVPGMADAEQVVSGFSPKPGVQYYGLWLNEKGLERARSSEKLTLEGKISLYPSEKFLLRNNNRNFAQQIEYVHRVLNEYRAQGIPCERGSISNAFGCNFEGNIPISKVVAMVGEVYQIADEHDLNISELTLADTMAWATPLHIKRMIGAIREKYPDIKINLHLHDTRGLGIANAYAGLEMGVTMFDACVGGLGGCPFAGHAGAAGNVCTEDLVFLCDELGIETGINLEKMIECARLAEEVVGHPLPGSVMKGGSLRRLREAVRNRA